MTRKDYEDKYKLLINTIIAVGIGLRDSQGISGKEKLAALDAVYKYIPEVKRCILYFENTNDQA